MTLADMGHLGEIIIGAIIGALALAWRYGGKEQQLEGRVTRLEQWREGLSVWTEKIDEKLAQYGQRQASMFEKLDNLTDTFNEIKRDVRILRRRRMEGGRRRRPRMRTRWYDDLDEYVDDEEDDI